MSVVLTEDRQTVLAHIMQRGGTYTNLDTGETFLHGVHRPNLDWTHDYDAGMLEQARTHNTCPAQER